MVEKTVIVKSNLEARSAALFVQLASKFTSTVKITMNNKFTNCKSIMGMISLGILEGCQVSVCAEGEDEIDSVNELCAFLESDKH